MVARDGYSACKYNGKTFTHYTQKDGLAANTLKAIEEDAQGNIWFGTRVAEQDNPDFNQHDGVGGLYKYNGKTFKLYLGGLNNTAQSPISCIKEDSKGNIWLGGLYRLKGNTVIM